MVRRGRWLGAALAVTTLVALPAAAQIDAARRWVMIAAHLFLLIPLAAVFLARGVGTV